MRIRKEEKQGVGKVFAREVKNDRLSPLIDKQRHKKKGGHRNAPPLP
jgi:hypothetical protein